MWSKYSYTMEKLYFDRVKKKKINRLNKQIYYEYSMYINGGHISDFKSKATNLVITKIK